MGTVYRAVNGDTGATVAVKVLDLSGAGNAKIVERFQLEFQSALKLDHPNVVRALDFGCDDGKVYIVMELIDGITLSQAIDEGGAMPEATAVRIATQVAQALNYAHQRRIVHRDVKPDNILIRADGLAKLADFGLAKDFDDDQGLTKPLTGLGTPHFMAPEQYEDAKNAGVLCDVYSLGATLYCAVTGKLPFSDCASLVALTRKIKGDIAPPRVVVPELSEEVDFAIRKAMSPDPAKRPASIMHFIRMLQSGKSKSGESSTLVPQTPHPAVERRAAVRHLVALPGSCAIDTSAHDRERIEDWPAVVRDLSVSGMGLILARRFELGTLFCVEVTAEDESAPPRKHLVRVCRILSESQGHWFHGCALVDTMQEEHLSTLIR